MPVVQPVDEANGPIAKQPHGACHDTLPLLICFSLDLDTFRSSMASSADEKFPSRDCDRLGHRRIRESS